MGKKRSFLSSILTRDLEKYGKVHVVKEFQKNVTQTKKGTRNPATNTHCSGGYSNFSY